MLHQNHITMKKLFNAIVAVAVIALCNGCGITLPAVMNHNYSTSNIEKRLQTDDYRIVRRVEGSASAVYVLEIGGLSRKAARAYTRSYDDMVENAQLEDNQAVINVVTEDRAVSVLGLVTVRKTVSSGTVIEFTGTSVDSPSTASGLDSSPNTSSELESSPKKYYKIGDYYNDGEKEGIVFYVDKSRLHGKIVSMEESLPLQWSQTDIVTQANDIENGLHNQQVITALDNWKEEFPAFAFCAQLGEGWYLPAYMELQNIMQNRRIISASLKRHGYKYSSFDFYWTSTEKKS